jgi:predicted nucleotidyltransferase
MCPWRKETNGHDQVGDPRSSERRVYKLYFHKTKVYFHHVRATHTIESIFGTRSRTRVLWVLHGVAVPLNAAQVARQAGLSQPGAAAALRELEGLGLVQGSQIGWARAYLLVRENIYVERIVAPAFVAQEAMGDELLGDLKRAFSGRSVAVVLFGSYARDEQRSDSDIDVVLVAADSVTKQELEEISDIEMLRLRRVWGATVATLVYDVAEAADLHQSAPSLYAEIERDAIVVSGMPPREWRDHGGNR